MARRGNELSEHIIFAAKLVFLEMGFERASMDEIASRAKTSKRSLYAHFESKEKLYLAIMDSARRIFLGRLKMPGDYSENASEALVIFCGRFQEVLLFTWTIKLCRLSMIAVERFPESAAQEVTLPVTINGQSTGGPDVDWYRFTGVAGQRVLLDGYSKRIDSRMDLAITLFTEAGTIIGESKAAEADDALVDVTLPVNGLYFVKVHDAFFAQGPGYVYRITIGQLPYLDSVFPRAGLPGSNDEYTLLGRNLPGGQPSPFQLDGRPLDQLKVRIPLPGDAIGKLTYASFMGPQQAGMDGVEFRVANNGFNSNPVLVTPATAAIVFEDANNNSPGSPQKLTLPCEVAGSFYPQRDVDWFSFVATKDDVWSIDLYAQRLGQSCDAAILVVASGITPVSDITEAIARIRSTRVPIAGAVLNRVDQAYL